jgi:hypothetical protein
VPPVPTGLVQASSTGEPVDTVTATEPAETLRTAKFNVVEPRLTRIMPTVSVVPPQNDAAVDRSGRAPGLFDASVTDTVRDPET